MNNDLDLDLILYGVLLAVVGVLAHRSAPDAGSVTLIIAIAGGCTSVIWGIIGLRGFRRRLWPIGTLIVVVVVLLIQAVRLWLEVRAGNDVFKFMAASVTMLLGLGIGQLVNFVQAHRQKE